MMKKMGDQTAIFICTPELVGSWIFYPAWLCMPNLYPRALVMDYIDLERCYKEANSVYATPYDIVTWQTLKTYIDYGFLISHDPLYNKPFQSGSVPLSYSKWTSQKELDEFKSIARKIVNSLSKDQLHQIVYHGYKGWKHFGLELKKYFKGKDPLFATAIEKTNIGISQIERGLMPIDPKALIRRYLLKLLVGLHIRKIYSKMANISEGYIRIFDTPEYKPAAKLLIRNLNIEPNSFAIPTDTPERNESFIREVLGLKDSGVPLCSQDLDLLYDAVEQIKRDLNSGISEIEIRRDISSKIVEARRKVLRKDIIGALSLSSANIPTWIQVGKALLGSPPNDVPPLIVSLLSIVVAVATGESFLRDAISNYPSSVKFIVTREILYNFNPIFKIKQTWLRYLLSLARKFKPRPVTEERIRRQMMEPWIENPTWYDP
ncbi:MAG: hypothetical protein AB1393_04840 [Candidatus Edwardsbacteria bacterium]